MYIYKVALYVLVKRLRVRRQEERQFLITLIIELAMQEEDKELIFLIKYLFFYFHREIPVLQSLHWPLNF